MRSQELKSIANYSNGIYCMETCIVCLERPMSFIVIITHKGRTYGGDNWARMHDNLQLWGSSFDIDRMKEEALTFEEEGTIDNYYIARALYPKEEACLALRY